MSTPSRPVNITSPRLQTHDTISGSPTPVGTPDLRALRAQYSGTPPLPNIPARYTPNGPNREGSPSVSVVPVSVSASHRPSFGGASARRPGAVGTPGSGSDANPLDLDDLPDEEKARFLRRHLVYRTDRHNRSDANSVAGSDQDAHASEQAPSQRSTTPVGQSGMRSVDVEAFPIPYDAPGADVTHDIYKWHTDQRRQSARPRASSFAGSEAPHNPAFDHIHEPGGFRRNYVLLRANENGEEEPRVLNNFIDFLMIFGHFAGEDLEEDEEEDRLADEEADAHAGPSGASALAQSIGADENQPLLSSKPRSRSRRRAASVGPHGDATMTQAILMLLKSFIGTGVLFLGKAFANGGLIFSLVTIAAIALISLYSFLLLVRAKFVVSGSFGDIGGALYGPWLRYAILSSITISQIGFVTAYTIFVAENLQAFLLAASKCVTQMSVPALILVQLVIFLPLAMIRNLAKLSTAALVADVFILAGILYIFGSELSIISKDGIAEIKMFNSKDFPLFIGTAVFSFEGIGLVIPITDAMREPRKFPKALTGVMLSLLVLFGGAGALSYLTFGSNVQAVVLVNLDQENRFTQAVQFLYSLAILLSIPLQFFPAVRILENGIFTRSGKADPYVKWMKNLFRCGLVMVCTVISWAGAADLDKFVALIGSFACVPLCFVYPAMLHYRACARTRREKIADIVLGVFGVIAAVYTTYQTLKLMAEPAPGTKPGKCEVVP
ncbi:amino acid transporter [Serpula lacrymans var. lacrymans S7.9]|uniref:Amino acid transporter n=1 Tax=Serpula lacrymans var. lacrymans (strain S7.9) TaxID=578457 RepID=F8NWT1_SERL9|nr:amino acid transporter [Serpula lacrymans var. lacrymans S7.9]EGO25072.1 amino acid transporter [Serpula lacrymans var. lacrymans S7.9]